MTRTLFLSALMIISCLTMGAQATMTTHFAFDCRDASEIDLTGLGGKVEIRQRGGSRILVEMSIVMENGNYVLMEALQKEGYFAVEMAMDGAAATIHRPAQRHKERYASGDREEAPNLAIGETVTYLIYVPPHQMQSVRISEEQKIY
jgi:hypothetical protein